jgi:hypothetical protein
LLLAYLTRSPSFSRPLVNAGKGYTKLGKEIDHRCTQAVEGITVRVPRRGRKNPFALPPSEHSATAFGALSEFEVAWPFTPLEIGADDDFIERWITWFAQAAQGQLSNPSSMPERNPQGS